MEQLYRDIQRKIDRSSVQESNPYMDRKNKLQREYLERLDKTIKEYPSYEADLENDYNRQLSLLNGITKQLDDLHKDIKDHTRRLESEIETKDRKIQRLKQSESNLKQTTSIENLDATSKQMLADHVTKYNRQQLLFWIKLGVIAFIITDFIHDKQYTLIGILVLMTLVFGWLYFLYQRYTSRG